ncbi:two-component system response regulator [Campylobacter avium LMG 24591]|uniref:Two-component system response regulator n=1 Tax=Campylobacter avium LMG 24591 TaxID=522484 RepID=A0A222MWM5_9BACT|nr:response regulator transcription factor [Campylobacter avium]ASQ30467.1 two-component system response regulator [Campylobacter avium LMG 24591]OYD79564.1 two-component system response regulator [Campylobacter avium]
MRILLVEDDSDLNELLTLRFKSLSYEVHSFLNLDCVKTCLDENEIDLLILDRNICGEDALNFVKSLREEAYNEPVIFLTAKALKRDILEGFESGCDDYVCKPFDFDELLLRMKALLKRSKRQNSKISFKNILLDIENRQCFEDNQEVKVSNLEFELLKCFFENKNVLLTRQFLSENVWLDEFTNDKSINIAITRLRNKFKVLKEQIHSIRGVGYKLC